MGLGRRQGNLDGDQARKEQARRFPEKSGQMELSKDETT